MIMNKKKVPFPQSQQLMQQDGRERVSGHTPNGPPVPESDTARKNACDKLRLLLSAEANLTTRTDDIFLIRFLRATKLDVHKAFGMIKRYFATKEKNPELCVVPRPSEILHLLDLEMQTFLDNRTQKGERVYIFRLDKVDMSAVSIDEIFMTNILCAEAVSLEPITQLAGIVSIIDLSGFSLHQHAAFFSPHYSSRTVQVVQGSFPLRFKEIHVINEPFYFGAVYALLKPFLKEKIRKRIYFHGQSLKSLHNHVDPTILPSDYGGLKPKLSNTVWKNKLLQLDEWFAELQTYGYHCI